MSSTCLSNRVATVKSLEVKAKIERKFASNLRYADERSLLRGLVFLRNHCFQNYDLPKNSTFEVDGQSFAVTCGKSFALTQDTSFRDAVVLSSGVEHILVLARDLSAISIQLLAVGFLDLKLCELKRVEMVLFQQREASNDH
jgi:hypothetical protein